MNRVFFLALLLLLWPFPVKAAEAVEEGDYDYSEIEEYLSELMGENRVHFSEIISQLLEGDFSAVLEQLGKLLSEALSGGLSSNAAALKQILLVALFGALLSHFATAFSREGIGETGFFVTYLLLVTLLLAAFQSTLSIGETIIGQLLRFMSVLLPVFFMAVVYAGGSVTALTFYQLVLLVISAVQWLFLTILMPLILVYVSLLLVNSLFHEDFLSRLADLLHTLVTWSLKTLLGLVLGLNLIQGLVLPLVDSVKSSTLRRAVGAIPWLGNGGEAVAQVLLGSGAMIKNAIGMAAVLVLVILCLIPVVKLGLVTFLYQGAAAVLQPVADERIAEAVQAVSEGTKLVLQLVLYTLILFIVTLAIICAASNANYYAG